MEILNNATWIPHRPLVAPTACDGRTHGGDEVSNGRPLGILTKYASIPDFKGLAEIQLRRAVRYALQNEVVKLLPSERVRFCLKHRITKDKGVEVRYNESRGKAHYSNVQRCGSVWVCPVCSAQISEGRRQELKQGVNGWREQGGAVYLLTLTNSHHLGDDLGELLQGQTHALKRFFSNRKSKAMMQALGKVGHIRALEVTHGVNGWHPHYHILLFFDKPINVSALRGFFASVWRDCCVKSGLKAPSMEHGADLREGKYADKYVTKWGLEDEMTKGHTKKGQKDSLTPWDLLKASEAGDDKAGALFQEFARVFKGKRQLNWSNGLKALLAVDEVTDEELALQTDKDSVEVKELALELWRLIKRYKERAGYLSAVEHDIRYGSQRADNLIMKLAERYTKDHIHELMKEEGLHHVRAEVLRI